MLTNTARYRQFYYYGLEEEWAEIIIQKIRSGDFIAKSVSEVIKGFVYVGRLIGFVYHIKLNKILTYWKIPAYKPAKDNFLKRYTIEYLSGEINQKDIFNKVCRAHKRKKKKNYIAKKYAARKLEALSYLQLYIEQARVWHRNYWTA